MMLTNELLLLKIVSDDGSLLPLRQRGLTPSQIALLLQKQADAGNIDISIDGLSITDTGKQVLVHYYNEHSISGPSQWILPQESYYCQPMEKTKIILPKKKFSRL